jgi:hypothetical protein
MCDLFAATYPARTSALLLMERSRRTSIDAAVRIDLAAIGWPMVGGQLL